MTPEQKQQITAAIATAAEVVGTELTTGALKAMVRVLSRYDFRAVMQAVESAMLECKYKITLADIIERIPDDRPRPSEAWAMVPKSESESAVLPDEAVRALGVANPIIHAGDMIAARRAFVESYERFCAESKRAGEPVRWRLAAGWDAKQRDDAVIAAAREGKLGYKQTAQLLPHLDKDEIVAAVKNLSGQTARLTHEQRTPTESKNKQRVMALISKIKKVEEA